MAVENGDQGKCTMAAGISASPSTDACIQPLREGLIHGNEIYMATNTDDKLGFIFGRRSIRAYTADPVSEESVKP